MGIKWKDLLWKGALEDFFPCFMRMVIAEADKIFDFTRKIEFLDKELAEINPYDLSAEAKRIDILAYVYLKPGSRIRVHVEVEDNPRRGFARRVFTYFYRLLDKYGAPVLSIVVFLRKRNKNSESFYKYAFCGNKVDFEFNACYVGELDEDKLTGSENPFSKILLTAKLALIKNEPVEVVLDKKINIARQILDLIIPIDKKLRLLDFLKNYIRFEENEINNKFEQEINKLTNKKTGTMGITEQIIYLAKEEGIQQGVKDGIQRGRKASMEQVSKNLLKEGLDFDLINKVTSISFARLKRFKKELQLKIG